MRLDRTAKTFLAAALATSAIVMILAAAPAASTSGHDAVHGTSTHPATSRTRSSVTLQASASLQGSPLDEVAVMRAAAADRRHEAWLARIQARKIARGPAGSAASTSTLSARYAGGSVGDLVVTLFARIAGAGQVSTALCVANRESSFDPYARNRYSSAAGVFQWVASSWRSYSARYGFAGASVFDAFANISVAAHAVASGGWGPGGGGCW